MKSTHKKAQHIMKAKRTVETAVDAILNKVDSERAWPGFTDAELRELSKSELEEIVRKHGTPGQYVAFRLGGAQALRGGSIFHAKEETLNTTPPLSLASVFTRLFGNVQNYPTYTRGTGEEHVKTPLGTVIALNNMFIKKKEAEKIAAAVAEAFGKTPPPIVLSRARTVNRWGTATQPGKVIGGKWRKNRDPNATSSLWVKSEQKVLKFGRVQLYRHSIWVLLHELAHIMAGPGKAHGPVFGQTLDRIVSVYFDLAVASGGASS